MRHKLSNCCHLQILQQREKLCVTVKQKYFPTQLILKQISGQGNFRFATQLLEIQSPFWLSSWLAPLLNKAPIVWNL